MQDITILHVFLDEKFFDPASDNFDRLEGVNNLYYLYSPDQDYQFRLIKKTEKVIVIHDFEEYKKLFSSKNIDVILFHSLRLSFFYYFKFIDKSKTVIWWSWGGDIYNPLYKDVKPLIDMELYKPITKKYMEEHSTLLVKRNNYIFNQLRRFKHRMDLQRIIKRVDYFLPCMSTDYELLKTQCRYFRANSFPYVRRKIELPLKRHTHPGHILLGNSLTYTNNHLDIFAQIQSYSLDLNRKYIIPVNYGWGNAFDGNPENLVSLCNIEKESVIWLKDYLDRNEYFKLFDNVTHAIFGVLRQQALGNIYKCLRDGVKVYLYKDSVVSQQLREDGYVFYTIDDDLTEASLSECLSEEDALHNFQLAQDMFSGKSFLQAQELLHDISSKKFSH